MSFVRNRWTTVFIPPQIPVCKDRTHSEIKLQIPGKISERSLLPSYMTPGEDVLTLSDSARRIGPCLTKLACITSVASLVPTDAVQAFPLEKVMVKVQCFLVLCSQNTVSVCSLNFINLLELDGSWHIWLIGVPAPILADINLGEWFGGFLYSSGQQANEAVQDQLSSLSFSSLAVIFGAGLVTSLSPCTSVQAYLAGLTFALAASPCSTPVLASLLGYVAVFKDPVVGGSLLLTYTIGYAAPLLLAASFAGALQSLLSFRKFSAWINPISGALLLGGGVYTLLDWLFPATTMAM